MDSKLINSVNEYRKRLEKGVSVEKTLHILRKLERYNLTVDQLKEVGVGKVVKKLGKHENYDVREKAKSLANRWKNLLYESPESETNNKSESKHEKREKNRVKQESPETPKRVIKRERSPDSPVNDVKARSVYDPEASWSTKSCQPSISQAKMASGDNKPTVRPDRRLPSLKEVKEAAERMNGTRNNVDSNANRMLGVTSRKVRTNVYSGHARSTQYTHVLRLEELCIRVLMDNIDKIAYLGCIPYYLIKPVLKKCTASQLIRIEDYNPAFIDEDDELWFEHCQTTFRNCEPDDGESWREVYIRCEYERDAKLKSIAGKIKRTNEQSLPVRKTMVCETATFKPSKHVQRLQEKLGVSSAMGSVGKANVVVNRAAAREAVSKAPVPPKKPKTAPLMAKSLQLMKSRFRR
ncbi:transcription elongation factor B polypeptide 3-like protein [Leptotrombidium deliense]|uniref:Transcription elongation factor B polypeptide 3-like protein n=1 Tax=Leptotrombidium deliense TaxID=299467 RepID=A0A443SI49_9ACAR|nr:transcription elongation factor B polypeptide 3-like protein [Leptotrombidium deliense]